MGIGFAIPAQTARQVLEGLIKDGQVTRGWLGVEPQEITPELAANFNLSIKEGVVVTGVLANGPADQAGIKPGDAIRNVGTTPIHNVSELLAAVAALKPGERANITIQRGDREIQITAKPANRPKLHAKPQR